MNHLKIALTLLVLVNSSVYSMAMTGFHSNEDDHGKRYPMKMSEMSGNKYDQLKEKLPVVFSVNCNAPNYEILIKNLKNPEYFMKL